MSFNEGIKFKLYNSSDLLVEIPIYNILSLGRTEINFTTNVQSQSTPVFPKIIFPKNTSTIL